MIFRYFLLTLLGVLSLAVYADEDYTYKLSDEEMNELEAGQLKLLELDNLVEGVNLTLNDVVVAALPMVGRTNDVAPLALLEGKKKPGPDNGYYTINGNCDITIHGYEKQSLYANAVTDWSLEASYTMPVSNVGYLTYNDITLCDVEALASGTDYSEFITGVTINGFSSNYEYRLELHNGQVTLWAKLPGESPSVPEGRSVLYCLASGVMALYRKREK